MISEYFTSCDQLTNHVKTQKSEWRHDDVIIKMTDSSLNKCLEDKKQT